MLVVCRRFVMVRTPFVGQPCHKTIHYYFHHHRHHHYHQVFLVKMDILNLILKRTVTFLAWIAKQLKSKSIPFLSFFFRLPLYVFFPLYLSYRICNYRGNSHILNTFLYTNSHILNTFSKMLTFKKIKSLLEMV